MARTRELPALGVLANGVELLKGNYARAIHESLSDRLELRHVFGLHGLPQLNAVTDWPATNTYSTTGAQAAYTADRHFEIAPVGNAVSTDVSANAEGGINVASHAGGTDFTFIVPHLNSGQSGWTGVTWGTDQETHWRCRIKSGSSVANSVVYGAGLKLSATTVLTTDTDQTFFRAVGGANWFAVDSNTNVDNSTDTGVALAASTDYLLEIIIDASRIPHYYINGNLVANGVALKDATDLIPMVGILEASAAAKTVILRSMGISRLYA